MPDLRVALGLLAVGIVMLIASLFWSRDLGINRSYSDEDAQEYQEASSALHAAADHSHSVDGDQDEEAADLAAAQTRLDNARAERDAALTRRDTGSSVLKWGGIVFLLSGIGAYWIQKQRG